MSNSDLFPRKKGIWVHCCLLLFWLVIGTALRFINLESKPPWADEWATLVFSLGHSFRTIPLDRLISLDTLLLPVQFESTTQPTDAIAHLMSESTHPPVYFVLTHLWFKLFSHPSGLVDLWLARSLSAWFGIAAIPAMFGIGWLLFGSLLAAQTAAGLMAVSPYGIYLAQETRHYTLAILWVIASLACLVVTIRHLEQKLTPPNWLMLVWVVVNSVGIATHYFFGLTLIAETLVLLLVWFRDLRAHKFKNWFTSPWRRVGTAISGTLVGCSVWVFTWRDIPDSKLTEWIHHGNPLSSEFFEPWGRLCGWVVSMLFLLPIEGTSLAITVLASVFLLLVLVWLGVNLWTSLPTYQQHPHTWLASRVLGRFILAAILLVLSFTYFFDTDLTQAARFQFFYFPGILLLIAGVFANIWQDAKTPQGNLWLIQGKSIVIVTLLMGFLGGLTVISNFAYQKPDRPDLVVPVIREAQQLAPNTPTIIATVHKTHEQTGEMMGLAWEWQQRYPIPNSLSFLLLHKEDDASVATQNLQKILAQLPRPLDLWLINFSAPAALQCNENENFSGKVPGYRYRLYHCP